MMLCYLLFLVICSSCLILVTYKMASFRFCMEMQSWITRWLVSLFICPVSWSFSSMCRSTRHVFLLLVLTVELLWPGLHYTKWGCDHTPSCTVTNARICCIPSILSYMHLSTAVTAVFLLRNKHFSTLLAEAFRLPEWALFLICFSKCTCVYLLASYACTVIFCKF